VVAGRRPRGARQVRVSQAQPVGRQVLQRHIRHLPGRCTAYRAEVQPCSVVHRNGSDGAVLITGLNISGCCAVDVSAANGVASHRCGSVSCTEATDIAVVQVL